jgi:uncharacterized protein YkwD
VDGGLVPTPADLARVRAAVLCLVNRERERAGEAPLVVRGSLLAAAQGHTESMVGQGYFEHISPDGATPLERMRAAGYGRGAYTVGENIAWGTGSLSTPAQIVTAWMASPPHRANILDAEFVDTGVGAAARTPAGGAGGLYTQDFGSVGG